MNTKEEKILYSSKPTIWYYLLALFFPIMFFLVDDSSELILEHWDKSVKIYVINILALFMFFGVPVLMLVFRREIIIYPDKINIYKPSIKTINTYYFTDLVKWNISDIYIPKAGRQVGLTLKFKNKKLDFHKIELKGFSALLKLLEDNYQDKKQ